jgi:ABC-2 type transport system ATP-binding protein
MILNVINPTSGSYQWFGSKPDKRNLQMIGSILETPSFYPYLSAVDNLKIIAEIKGAGYSGIDEALRITGIYERRYSAFRTFSLGMKQRMALAATLIGDPRVLILDEPTNGLDPRGIAEIRDLIRTIASKGKTIILASHLLDEVQKVCTHFAVLNKGQLKYAGPVNEARNEQIIELAADQMDDLTKVLNQYPGISEMEITDTIVTFKLPADYAIGELSRFIFNKGIAITHMVSRKKSLEAQFLEILNDQA